MRGGEGRELGEQFSPQRFFKLLGELFTLNSAPLNS